MAWFIIKATTPKGKCLFYCGDGGTKTTYRKTRDPHTLCTVTKRVYNEQLFSTVYCSFMGELTAKKTLKDLQKMPEKYSKCVGYSFELERADPSFTAHFAALNFPLIVGATVHLTKDYKEYDFRKYC